MSLKARREYLNAIRERYKKSTKREKTVILNEFCVNCLYTRKHAIQALSQGAGTPRKRPGAAPVYGPELIPFLKELWEAMDQIGPKKMVAAFPDWLRFYQNPELTTDLRQLLLSISASTVARLLKHAKKPHGISSTRPGTYIKSRIPIAILDWNIGKPGFLEADTVAHCGSSLIGNFINSLTVTDIFSSWTENRATWTKGSARVIEQFKDIEKSLPFDWLGLGCDNGSEFINHSVEEFCEKGREKKIEFTRSRAYKKNDNCYVEQKNFTHVRQLFGYDRLDQREMVPLVNEIYRDYWGPLMNFFIPSIKLIRKVRVGAKMKKTYDKPQTPYKRLMDSVNLTDPQKVELEHRYNQLNPFELKAGLEKKMKEFNELLKQAESPRLIA